MHLILNVLQEGHEQEASGVEMYTIMRMKQSASSFWTSQSTYFVLCRRVIFHFWQEFAPRTWMYTKRI